MVEPQIAPATASPEDAILLTLKSIEARVTKLEEPPKKNILKRLTESASASALFLGLVLTFASMYDVFVLRPETDRITRLSKFNEAVNSAAKLRQDVVVSQLQSTNPQVQIAIASAVQPQILNNISTARAMLHDIKNADIGISQLIILISEALNTGDTESAKSFVTLAVSKTDVTLYLRSEAKRYEGKYFFAVGRPEDARKSFEAAQAVFGKTPASAMSRAFIQSDLVLFEYAVGDCNKAQEQFNELVEMLKGPGVIPVARQQMASTVKGQLLQMQGQHCPALLGVADL